MIPLSLNTLLILSSTANHGSSSGTSPPRAFASSEEAPERVRLLTPGSQVVVRHGDVVTLLAEAGRHVVLISIRSASADREPDRPDARGMMSECRPIFCPFSRFEAPASWPWE